MKEKIIILGNAIAAEIIYGVLNRDERFDVVAFSVNQSYIKQENMHWKPICPLETLSKHYDPENYKIINAIGYSNLNQNRESAFYTVRNQGFSCLQYIHPTATILSDQIGEGVFIMPGVIVEPYARIGTNSVLWSNVVIAHHAVIGDNCWIASGSVIAGEATIGRNTFVGVNATIVNKVTVGEYNIIGAGALISKCTQTEDVMLERSGEKHRFDSKHYAKFYGL